MFANEEQIKGLKSEFQRDHCLPSSPHAREREVEGMLRNQAGDQKGGFSEEALPRAMTFGSLCHLAIQRIQIPPL